MSNDKEEDNSSLTPEFLLREAYKLLGIEHEDGCVRVNDPPPPHGTAVCDVCDLLESIEKRMGISLESWASNLREGEI